MSKTWFDKAKEHLSDAKANYKFRKYTIALEKAVISAECALKAVLERDGKLDLSSFKADKHHKIPKLFKKIKKEKCLDPQMEKRIETIIGNEKNGGLGYFKFYSSKSVVMQCTAGEVVNIKYPSNWDNLKKEEKKYYAKQKMDEDESLLNILSILS